MPLIMTPAARIRSLEELTQFILAAPIPMDSVVGDYFRSRRYIGSKDRNDIAERVYTLIRHYVRLTWWCDRLNITPDARHLVLLFLALVDGRAANDIALLYDGSQYAPKPLSEDERRLMNDVAGKTLCPQDMPESVHVECPQDHEPRLRAVFKTEFRAAMTAMLAPATLDLRVNALKCTRDQAAASLAKDHVKATPTPFSPWGLRLAEKTFLSATNAFRHGLVDIQDEGSQLIAYVCGAQPGQQVLDFCAGGGGKTLALGNAMRNKGRIVAMDTVTARLEKSRLRFRRAGIADIVEVRPLSDEQHRKWLRRQKGTFDIVLVDAPCSGSGTWRRNPDGRFRTFGPSLEELIKTQTEILDRVAGAVKPGGRLVYATCSLFNCENEDQVAAFLERHPEFTIASVPDIWPGDAGTPCPVRRGTSPFMRLAPHTHQTDGFFAAVMVKKT